MTTIYLIRHGTTQANKENRFAGRTDEELYAEGVEQIHQVGDRFANKNISAIYCSPARRTKQSAEILGSLLNVSFLSLDELDEINIPHWDGLTKDEIRQKYGGEYPTWLNKPHTFCLAGCETLMQVQERAVGAVNRLLKLHNSESLLLVSHLIVLRCLVLYYQGFEIKDFRSIKIHNGSILCLSEDAMGTKTICPI